MSTLRPITFVCRETIPLGSQAIAAKILDVANWSEFRGYGPLPGIATAEFEHRTDEIVGSRICVKNTDGSSHVEEVIAWEPPRRVQLRLHGFRSPIARLACEFIETWEFQNCEGGTLVIRSFELYPGSALARPALWLVGRLLKRAIARHLREIRAG